MATQFSRRSVITAAGALGSITMIVKPTRAADHKFVQYHNQPAGGTLHDFCYKIMLIGGGAERFLER